MKLFLLFVALAYFVEINQAADGSFTYDDPSTWKDDAPICGNDAQSPINIETDDVECNKRTKLKVKYLYRDLSSVDLINDGKGIVFQFGFCSAKPAIIQWADQHGNVNEYQLDSAHIHWGPQCEGGSEHTVNGHRFAAEMHFVHFNTKYETLGDAVDKPDGLAVLGILFDQADESTFQVSKSNKWIPEVANLTNKDDMTTVSGTDFDSVFDFIKQDPRDFYTYKGSLTTPPCFESVRWLVSAEPIRLYPSELEILSNLYTLNYRPLQPLNGRVVTGSCRR